MACFWAHEFDKVELDGFQYCKYCGFARKPKSEACRHEWETEEKWDITYGRDETKRTIGKIFFLKCIKCGDREKREIRIDDSIQ